MLATSPGSDAGSQTGLTRGGASRWLTPPIITGLLALLLYVSCLAPTVTYDGDCGELISASWRLGIAHPTGYALYCLAGKSFAMLLPFGEVGWRYNLFSALCGALAVGLLAATLVRLVGPAGGTPGPAKPRTKAAAQGVDTETARLWLASCGGALLLAGFFYFWSQCVLAEVYATAGLLLSFLLFCAVSWRQTADWRWLYTLALMYGLTLNAHLSCVYLAPGLAVYCLYPERARLRDRPLRTAFRLALLFLAGYSLAVYLPLRASTFPTPIGQRWAPMDWTHPVDFSSFLAHISARQYRVWLVTQQSISLAGHIFTVPAWVQEPAVTRAKLLTFGASCALQLGWCIPLLLAGIISSWRRERLLFVMLASTVLLNLGVQIHYTVGDASNFFFPAYMAMGLWLGLGIAAVARRWGVKPVGAAVVSMLLLQIGIFYGLTSSRGETQARDDALARAGTLERLGASGQGTVSAFLFSDDALWAFWYAHFVLGRATGTRTPWGPERTRAIKSGTLWRMVAAAKKQGPVVLSEFDAGTDARFPLLPATEKGDLLLASDRELPPPARPLAGRLPATRSDGARSEVLKVGWNSARREKGVPAVKRSDAASLNVVFRPSRLMLHPLSTSRREASFTAGWIQVLLASEGKVTDPPPGQGAVRSDSPAAPPLIAWREERRLVLPLADAVSGAAANAVPPRPYQATISVNMDKDARLGRQQLWTRIVRERDDTVTPWRPAGLVALTGK